MSTEITPLRRRITPSVPFTLRVEDVDGGTFESSFRVAYDLNAFSLFEETTGINVLQNLGIVFDKPSISLITVLLWVGIRLYHPEYRGLDGLETLRANITMDTLSEVKTACTEAFLLSLPKEKAAKLRADAVAAANGGADPNGQSPASTTAA